MDFLLFDYLNIQEDYAQEAIFALKQDTAEGKFLMNIEYRVSFKMFILY